MTAGEYINEILTARGEYENQGHQPQLFLLDRAGQAHLVDSIRAISDDVLLAECGPSGMHRYKLYMHMSGMQMKLVPGPKPVVETDETEITLTT